MYRQYVWNNFGHTQAGTGITTKGSLFSADENKVVENKVVNVEIMGRGAPIRQPGAPYQQFFVDCSNSVAPSPLHRRDMLLFFIVRERAEVFLEVFGRNFHSLLT